MNEPVTQTKKIRKKFDKAFKQHAVELWLNSGKRVTEVARELGIDPQRLCTWRSQFNSPARKGDVTGAKPTPDQLESEIARLQRENQYLRERCDILKKTLGILSEPPKSDTSGSTR